MFGMLESLPVMRAAMDAVSPYLDEQAYLPSSLIRFAIQDALQAAFQVLATGDQQRTKDGARWLVGLLGDELVKSRIG